MPQPKVDPTGSSSVAQLALDKLEAAEAVARFFNALQRYHCNGTDWDVVESLIADEIIYLSPNFREEVPKPRDEFLAWFIDVTADCFGGRGYGHRTHPLHHESLAEPGGEACNLVIRRADGDSRSVVWGLADQ
jgi:hypothetical protein